MLQPGDMSEKQQCLAEKSQTYWRISFMTCTDAGKGYLSAVSTEEPLITLLPNRTGRRDMPTSLYLPWHLAYSG